MPEVLEVEMYRRALDVLVPAVVESVRVLDPAVVRHDADLAELLVGCTVGSTSRHGKLLMLHTDGPVLGWHFGMTGRLLVDGVGPIDALAYGPQNDDGRWDRFELVLRPVGGLYRTVRFSDPRRLGWVGIDPNLDGLGVDVWAATSDDFAEAFAGRRAPVKAVLLDQHTLAGFGNMLADELLLRSGIDPARPARSLSQVEVDELAVHVGPMLQELFHRGGSHRGDLSVDRRRPSGTCPIDATPLQRRSIGGRTTWSCPLHQR